MKPNAAVKVVDDPLSVANLIIGSAWVDVIHSVTQGVIEQNRDFARRRSHGLCLAGSSVGFWPPRVLFRIGGRLYRPRCRSSPFRAPSFSGQIMPRACTNRSIKGQNSIQITVIRIAWNN